MPKTTDPKSKPAPAKRRRGRPKGSKTADRPVVEAVLTACPKCGSTDRADYRNRREQQHAGVEAGVGAYTHTVWRDTSCGECGQARTDRHRENRGAAEN